jgi:hypothetical protein
MALQIGTVAADSGLTKAIYDQMNSMLSPPLQAMVDSATGDAKTKAQQALDGARDGWRKLSFAIASGVVTHLQNNLEVIKVQATGDINATVSGNQATQAGVTFHQSNPGTGLVR